MGVCKKTDHFINYKQNITVVISKQKVVKPK
jgi:hypothetical protein